MRFFSLLFLFSSLLLSLEVKPFKLSQKEALAIAQKVWKNEGGDDRYLIWWNKGEDFASVGIGHFIWFPPHHTERFEEMFPQVLRFMKQEGVVFPAWLKVESDFPWRSKEALFRAKRENSPRYKALFHFLKRTMPHQADFMVYRLLKALPKMQKALSFEGERKKLEEAFYGMVYLPNGDIDTHGLYLLLDYVNFKGEGVRKQERYNGKGWGLLQLLMCMDRENKNKYRAFSEAGKYLLHRRIQNAPPQRGEGRWRRGWDRRLEGYLKP